MCSRVSANKEANDSPKFTFPAEAISSSPKIWPVKPSRSGLSNSPTCVHLRRQTGQMRRFERVTVWIRVRLFSRV